MKGGNIFLRLTISFGILAIGCHCIKEDKLSHKRSDSLNERLYKNVAQLLNMDDIQDRLDRFDNEVMNLQNRFPMFQPSNSPQWDLLLRYKDIISTLINMNPIYIDRKFGDYPNGFDPKEIIYANRLFDNSGQWTVSKKSTPLSFARL